MEYMSGVEAGFAPYICVAAQHLDNMGQSEFEMCVPDFVSQIEE